MILLSVALLGAATTSSVAAGPASGNPEIIVKGERTREQRIRTFVKAIAPAKHHTQITMFTDPVCPLAVGLPEQQNRMVEHRYRQVAQAAGAPVGFRGCATNVMIVVTGDKAEFIRGWRRLYPALFKQFPDTKAVESLATNPSHAAAWLAVGITTADDLPCTKAPGKTMPFCISNLDPSHITATEKPRTLAAIVVIDAVAVAGRTTRQVADYAAMRTLARSDARQLAELPADSILAMAESGHETAQLPESVTHWDFAALKALYHSSNRFYATQQRAAMAGDVGKYLAREGADGER